MADDNQNKQDMKKGLPNSFLLFLLTALLVVFMMQNIIGGKFAEISSSHQLEHLVNLELIKKEDSRKIALNDSLVTFSGKFKERKTEEAGKRFKYLKHLYVNNELLNEKDALSEELKNLRERIYEAADWFLHLKGEPLPERGYRVIDTVYDTLDRENHLIIHKLSEKDLISAADIDDRLRFLNERSLKDVEDFSNYLSALLKNFSSPILGIGNEEMKKNLKSLLDLLEGAERFDTPSRRVNIYRKILKELHLIINKMDSIEEHTRLGQLRSIRKYKEKLTNYRDLSLRLENNEALLEKNRDDVSSVVWYFNDELISTKSLEKQDRENFNHWFLSAKDEWETFEKNKGAVFKVPDQERNQVLEREFKSEEQSPPYINYLFTILPVVLVVLLLYFVFSRQMKGMGSGAMNFGKSPAKLLSKGQNKVTFKDVAGIDEAQEELQEIVEFLKNPGKFTSLGGRIPKGVLCIGPPGTGKTLIAKAVAGEADRPFFSISGSDFVEMFVGVGASRIRDMFEQAKKNAPCIIFMDEIDAVGRHRGAGIGGGHDEREQTLNQLLVEMDGFDSNEGVILVAATNRPDVLDKALLRPGRFDRRIVLDLPDIKGRCEILQLHARKIKMDDSVDLMSIARSTPGASGADLENLLNEAALSAARKNRKFVTSAETMEARDKVRYGKERRSLEIDEKEKETTAYHESGHAVLGMLLEYAEPLEKVTIIPRGLALGGTHFLPKKNRLSYWKKEIKDQLSVLMGGRIAEEIFVGDISSGAQNDIERATSLARCMVCEWGMSNLGTISYEEKEQGGQYLGGGISKEKKYSESTAEAIDKEVIKIISTAYGRAKDIINENKEKVTLMTKMLIEFETLDNEDLKEIMDDSWNIEEKRLRLKKAEELHKLPSPPPLPPTQETLENGEKEGENNNSMPSPVSSS